MHLLLLLLAVYAQSASAPAQAQGKDEAHCVPSPLSPVDGKQAPDVYDPPAFTKNTQGEIQEGAIYDESGNLLCVIPWKPDVLPAAMAGDSASIAARDEALQRMHGAFVYRSDAPLVRTKTFCESLVKKAAAGTAEPGLTRLKLTNNQILRRLAWMDGEGGCDSVTKSCPQGGGAACQVPQSGEPQMGSRYFAYAMENGKSLFLSTKPPAPNPLTDVARELRERDYLKQACSAYKPGTKEVVSLYEPYFVSQTSNTRFMYGAILEPARWVPNPPQPSDIEAANKTTPKFDPDMKAYSRAYEVAQRRLRVTRCLSDVILSVSKPESSPFASYASTSGEANAWSAYAFNDKKKVCGANSVQVNTLNYAGTASSHCFYNFKKGF